MRNHKEKKFKFPSELRRCVDFLYRLATIRDQLSEEFSLFMHTKYTSKLLLHPSSWVMKYASELTANYLNNLTVFFDFLIFWSALSAGAYTTTLFVMVDRVKGVGVHPPPSLPGGNFSIMIECMPESAWPLPLCVFCGLNNYFFNRGKGQGLGQALSLEFWAIS